MASDICLLEVQEQKFIEAGDLAYVPIYTFLQYGILDNYMLIQIIPVIWPIIYYLNCNVYTELICNFIF